MSEVDETFDEDAEALKCKRGEDCQLCRNRDAEDNPIAEVERENAEAAIARNRNHD